MFSASSLVRCPHPCPAPPGTALPSWGNTASLRRSSASTTHTPCGWRPSALVLVCCPSGSVQVPALTAGDTHPHTHTHAQAHPGRGACTHTHRDPIHGHNGEAGGWRVWGEAQTEAVKLGTVGFPWQPHRGGLSPCRARPSLGPWPLQPSALPPLWASVQPRGVGVLSARPLHLSSVGRDQVCLFQKFQRTPRCAAGSAWHCLGFS